MLLRTGKLFTVLSTESPLSAEHTLEPARELTRKASVRSCSAGTDPFTVRNTALGVDHLGAGQHCFLPESHMSVLSVQPRWPRLISLLWYTSIRTMSGPPYGLKPGVWAGKIPSSRYLGYVTFLE